MTMFEASEKWRKDFKVDELYDHFEYPEKEEVDKWYPQYYHKTDNVSEISGGMGLQSDRHLIPFRTADRYTLNSWASST
jgi:hypothetical protein